jgi:hypothetical protein
VPAAFALEAVAARGGVVRHVVGQVDRFGVHLGGQPDYLGGRLALADDQVGAALAEGLAQVGQGLGQEPGPVGAALGRVEGRVGHEQRHHLPGPLAGLVQGRVVVQPQVAGEEHDRGVHLAPSRVR